MKKEIICIICLVILTGILGCAPQATGSTSPITSISPAPASLSPTGSITTLVTPTSTVTPTIEPTQSPRFGFYRAMWSREAIYIFGTTDAPDDTLLQTELYKDGEAVRWWMGVQHFKAHNGKWDTSIRTGYYQVPVDRFPDFEPGYTLEVWDYNHPEAKARFVLPFPEPQPAPEIVLEGTQWKLISMDDKGILANSYISLSFTENTAGGYSGVNSYGGKYWIDNPNTLFVYDMTSTLIGGDESLIQQESAYYKYLTAV
jgi:hypothetical protein